MKLTKGDLYFYFSMLFAVWFAFSAGAWAYLANLFISFPFGILSVVLWAIGRRVDPNRQRYSRIPIVWIVGVAISLVILCALLASN